MRRAVIMSTAAGIVAVGAGVAAYNSGSTQTERSDCPGKIVCPITGELICIDQCPAQEQSAAAPEQTKAAGEQCCCCEGEK